MGQRAVAAFRGEGGKIRITTIQWSSYMEKNMRLLFENFSGDKKNLAGKLFAEITDNGHISSFDNVDSNYNYWNDNRDKVIAYNDLGDAFSIRGIQEAGEPETATGDDIASIVMNHYHAQDGWSVWYDVTNPNYIYIWMNHDYGGVMEPIVIDIND